MSLFIDVATGLPLDVEVNARETVGPDSSNVSTVALPGDPTAVQVTYAPAQSGFGQDRLDGLVNTLASFIVITGVDSTFIINGAPISNNAGLTFVDGAIIRVVYDVTQCAGSNYFVFDSGGNQISFPNVVLLGHEMAHAFHLGVGDSPPAGPAAEFQAETDENGYRSQFGLTLRDPNNHAGGCGFTGGGGGGTTISCLIASAAYGSPDAPQLLNVRRLRDVVIRQSRWGAELFDRLHEEYYRFSPQVAACMNGTPQVRQGISALIVEPFFEFLAVLEIYTRLRSEAAPTVETRLQTFQGARQFAPQVLAALTDLKRDLGEGRPDAVAFRARGDMLPLAIVQCLCDVIEATVPAGGYVSWALLDPLILFWRAITAGENPGATLLRGIDAWLSETPLPECYAILNAEAIQEDLIYLRGIWFTSQDVRLIIRCEFAS